MKDLRAVPATQLTVAAGQAACTALDVPANIAATAALVRRAADQGADLLVLPELFLTGYELTAIVADPQTYTLNPADPRWTRWPPPAPPPAPPLWSAHPPATPNPDGCTSPP
jgi:5-aminopentanamidase